MSGHGGSSSSSSHAEALEHKEIPLAELRTHFYATQPTELQRRGTGFMLHRETEAAHNQYGGVICDCIGLGKTLMTLSTIVEQLYSTRETAQRDEKTLIVASSTVMQEWINQALTHLRPNVLRVVEYHGPARSCPPLESFDILVTTYALVAREYRQEAFQTAAGTTCHWKGARGHESPFQYVFDRVVLDEAHTIRNPRTATSAACCALQATRRWALTATPVFNDIADWYGIINFLDAFPYCVKETFDHFISRQMFTKPHETVDTLNRFLLPIQLLRGKHHLELPPLTEETLWVDLSESERLFYDAYFDYSRDTIERLFSMQGWLRRTGWGRQGQNIASRARFSILTTILRLRQACVHPQMVIDAIRDAGDRERAGSQHPPEAFNGTGLYESAVQRLRMALEQRSDGSSIDECAVCLTNEPESALVPCGHVLCTLCAETLTAMGNARCPLCRQFYSSHIPIDEALREPPASDAQHDSNDDEVRIERPRLWASPGSKIGTVLEHLTARIADDPTTKALFFSQWIGALDIMCSELDRRGIRYTRIDGSIKHARDRFAIQHSFNTDPAITVLVCSLQCTNQGINLQGANIVYLFDVWWNDAIERQAGGRIHRVGQTRPCSVYHVIARETIEERIQEMQRRKRSIADATTGVRALHENWEVMVRSLLGLRGSLA